MGVPTVEGDAKDLLALREAAARAGIGYNRLRAWADNGWLRLERDTTRERTRRGPAARLTTLAWVAECRATVAPPHHYRPQEQHPLHRLDRARVAAIKRRLAANEGVGALARAYDVAPMTIRRIREGITWVDVSPTEEHTEPHPQV